MLIILKFISALVAFFYRMGKSEEIPSGHSINIKGTQGTFGHETSKSTIRATLVCFPLKSGVIFKLSEESILDGLMKLFGFAEEVQTGDQHFDKLIYIASDDRKFTHHLKEISELRELAIQLVIDRQGSIHCKGKNLVFRFKGDRANDREMLEVAQKFHQLISAIELKKTRLIDEFGAKVLLIESFVYSLSIYAIAGAMEYYFTKRTIYLYGFDVFVHGLKWGAIIAVILLGFIAFFLHRSSRGSRVIIESALVLGLSLPIGGMTLVSDVNRLFDHAPSIVMMKEIKKVDVQVHHGRRGRTTYTYTMTIAGPSAGDKIRIPTTINIDRDDYELAQRSTKVHIEIGKGRLKRPYFKEFVFY